ncbi:hypothetical protein Tco_0298740 [Tanacetum coccineum]
MSFDTSASPEHVSGLCRASLAKVISYVSPSVAPDETIPHYVPQSSIGKLIQADLNELIIKYNIPCDLHPRLPPSNLVMSDLPNDVIGIYHRIFDFSSIRIPFSTFLLVLQTLCKQGHQFSFAKRRASDPICIDDNKSCMKGWKTGFFLIDQMAIPDYMS